MSPAGAERLLQEVRPGADSVATMRSMAMGPFTQGALVRKRYCRTRRARPSAAMRCVATRWGWARASPPDSLPGSRPRPSGCAPGGTLTRCTWEQAFAERSATSWGAGCAVRRRPTCGEQCHATARRLAAGLIHLRCTCNTSSGMSLSTGGLHWLPCPSGTQNERRRTSARDIRWRAARFGKLHRRPP
jgi:hypothetical protein